MGVGGAGIGECLHLNLFLAESVSSVSVPCAIEASQLVEREEGEKGEKEREKRYEKLGGKGKQKRLSKRHKQCCRKTVCEKKEGDCFLSPFRKKCRGKNRKGDKKNNPVPSKRAVHDSPV